MSETVRTAVNIANVAKVFNPGKPNEVRALDHINLSIEDASFVSLIGPSGCGKSTLLRLMGALTHPTEGEVVINGKSADQARLDRDYGMAFQTSGLFDWRTVTQNVELPLQLMGWSKSDRKERAAENARSRQAQRVRRSLPERTVRRDAAACFDRKGTVVQAIAAAHG
jgi:NitT/TauT family transport system ATP-binding protein